MPGILKIVLHLSQVVRTVEDIEGAVRDLVQKKGSKADWAKVAADIESAALAGLLPLPPGMTLDEVKAIFGEIEKVL